MRLPSTLMRLTQVFIICMLRSHLILALKQYGCPRIASIVNIGACALPYAAGNFQGFQKCDGSNALNRPKDKAELVQVVLNYDKVQAVGTGLSWNREMFCPGEGPRATAIAMTEFENLQQIYIKEEKFWDTSCPDFPIKFDWARMTVTADAGVPLRSLLTYMVNQRTPQCPNGCFVAEVPQLIDQTVGGTLATSTHGSSSTKATLSSQMTAMTLLIANGTVLSLSEETNRHLFRAASVNVGRLGIILDATIRMVPQLIYRRTRDDVCPVHAVAVMRRIQDGYKAAKATGDPAKIQASLNIINSTLILWFQPEDTVAIINTYKTDNSPTLATKLADAFVRIPFDFQRFLKTQPPKLKAAILKTPKGNQQFKTTPLLPNLAVISNLMARCISTAFNILTYSGLSDILAPAYPAFPTTKPGWLWLWTVLYPSYEYEVCVPLEVAGDAMQAILDINDRVKNYMRTPTGFRFVPEEPAYLAAGNGGARMCMEIDDFTTLSSKKFNKGVFEVVQLLMTSFKGRLHWGKFGWPLLQPCFDGKQQWGDAWCHFGCAVEELDPTGKFSTDSDVWAFYAKSAGGTDIPFGSCCTASGFDLKKCSCARRPPCTTPPSTPEQYIRALAERDVKNNGNDASVWGNLKASPQQALVTWFDKYLDIVQKILIQADDPTVSFTEWSSALVINKMETDILPQVAKQGWWSKWTGSSGKDEF